MYAIVNIIKVKQDCLDRFLTGVYQHAQHSSAEPGCVRYDVLQDVSDPQIVVLYEVFHDEGAFREHLTQDYYKAWMENSREWRHSEGRVRHVLDYVYGPEQMQGQR